MNEPTLGPYLRQERERRGLTLKTISESTKVSVALLEGLEADDISRWPGGIFRRAFVRSYAQCVGLDADEVYKRFEAQHQPAPKPVEDGVPSAVLAAAAREGAQAMGLDPATMTLRARAIGTAADLMVVLIVAFATAAAGSRLLWPVLLIAVYYAAGILVTGTSPMVALLGESFAASPAVGSNEPAPASGDAPSGERRHQPQRMSEPPAPTRGVQVRAQ